VHRAASNDLVAARRAMLALAEAILPLSQSETA